MRDSSGLSGLFLSFDWFQATFYNVGQDSVSEDEFIQELLGVARGFGFRSFFEKGGKGLHGYLFNSSIVNVEGDPIFRILHGGVNRGMHVNVTVSGIYAEVGRSMLLYLRENFGYQFRVTRADIALDFKGDYDKYHELLYSLAPKRVKTSVAGDWARKEYGRTFYYGSRGGRAFVRFYEKGKEQREKRLDLLADEDWLRLEFEYRPERDERDFVSGFTAEEMIGRVKWVFKMFKELSGFGVETEGGKINRRRSTSLDGSLSWMCKQYSDPLSQLFEKCSGDVEKFGRHLIDLVAGEIRLVEEYSGEEELDFGLSVPDITEIRLD